MDMDNSFIAVNKHIAISYWYAIAATTGFAGMLNISHRVQNRLRRRSLLSNHANPTKPNSWVSQAYATATALFRESSLPSVPAFSSSPLCSQFTPPSLGRLLVIGAYTGIIVCLLTVHAIESGAYFYEKIAYRAAWLSITQVPFVVLLAGKHNLFTLISGLSAERINFMHRTVGRVLFASATVHMSFFLREWKLSDFLQTELEIMPMVKYGLGSYGILCWILMTTVIPVRYYCYEFFIINHLASIGALLWCLYQHVPSYAAYNVWLSIGFIAFDRIIRLATAAWINVNRHERRLGFDTEITRLQDGMVRVIIKSVPVTWQPGQYIKLNIPSIRPFESHPFTIANFSSTSRNDILLLVKPQSGFTASLYKHPKEHTTSLITGPYGCPPSWHSYETLVLIATSTGISFTMPILEAIATGERNCVRQIKFYWVIRHVHDLEVLTDRIEDLAAKAEAKGISVTIGVFVTCGDLKERGRVLEVLEPEQTACCGPAQSETQSCREPKEEIEIAVETKSCCAKEKELETTVEKKSCCAKEKELETTIDSCCSPSSDSRSATPASSSCRCCSSLPLNSTSDSACRCEYKFGRQSLASLIIPAVESAVGETCITVCANKTLSTEARNLVARLSDERAVHKGSGAQGILLYCEGFGL